MLWADAGTVAFARDEGVLAVQSLDPSSLLDLSPTALAALAFLATVVFGGGVVYAAGGRVDRAVESSMTNPFVSVLYGVVAFGLVVFLVGYAYSQLARLGVGRNVFATLTVLLIGVLVLVLSGVGFAVVGVWLSDVAGTRDPWLGLVVVGGVGAVAFLLLPLAVAAVVWFAIAGVGVGGPTREWIHADEAEASVG
jgi:hypothetical protein